MFKGILFRLLGLAIAIIAFAPAAVAVLKGQPPFFARVFRGLYHPIWWWRWVWAQMPAIRAPWSSWSDFGWSLPGLLSVACLGIGLGLLLHSKKRQPRRHWEDEP